MNETASLMSDDLRVRFNTLTEREAEVVRLVAEGLRNSHIAERLGISIITVRHHLSSVFDKLRVGDRFELTMLALRTGYVRLPLGTVQAQMELHKLSLPAAPAEISVKVTLDTTELEAVLTRLRQDVVGLALA